MNCCECNNELSLDIGIRNMGYNNYCYPCFSLKYYEDGFAAKNFLTRCLTLEIQR